MIMVVIISVEVKRHLNIGGNTFSLLTSLCTVASPSQANVCVCVCVALERETEASASSLESWSPDL